MTINDLEVLKNESIEKCDKDDLVDLKSVNVNMRKQRINRILEFVNDIKNPYLFKVGGMTVKIEFVGDKTINEAVVSALKAS